MKNRVPVDLRWLHLSVVAVWLATAVVSLQQWHVQSSTLLQEAGLAPGWHGWLIGGGAAADLLLGLWLWLRPSRLACGAALAGMAIMTIAATALLPGLWLHPLGPLTKNLPIAAALLLLMRNSRP